MKTKKHRANNITVKAPPPKKIIYIFFAIHPLWTILSSTVHLNPNSWRVITCLSARRRRMQDVFIDYKYTVHSVRLYSTNIHNNKLRKSLMWKFMLCKWSCNRLFRYPTITELLCEVSANISSMNKSSQPQIEVSFFCTCELSTKKFKKKKFVLRRVLTLYFCCCCHWCLLVLHDIFEYDKRKRYIHLPHVCSLCIYIQWLPFAKKRVLTIWANVI